MEVIIVPIVLGPSGSPKPARAHGSGIRNFRRSLTLESSGDDGTEQSPSVHLEAVRGALPSHRPAGPRVGRLASHRAVAKLGPGALEGPVFEPLRDPELFAQVTVDPESGTVVWPTGANLDPIVVYEGLPPLHARVVRKAAA